MNVGRNFAKKGYRLVQNSYLHYDKVKTGIHENTSLKFAKDIVKLKGIKQKKQEFGEKWNTQLAIIHTQHCMLNE